MSRGPIAQTMLGSAGADTRMTFSDFMTGFFQLVWPKMGVAAAKIVDEKFSQALDDAIKTLPALNGKVSYHVQFGDSAPKIDAVHSYRKHVGSDVGIEICGELRWEASVDMKVRVGPMLIGVNRVSLRGTGCIVVKPLLDREPVIGGLQIFFCDMPALDLGLTGLGGITAWSLVSDGMVTLMNEAFRKMMVLPSRLSVRFANTYVNDMPSFKNPPPIGIFRVRLVDARDLVAMDWSLRGRLTSDPYCIFRVGNADRRSRTIFKTCQPDWDTDEDVFDFHVFHERQLLQVDLYDHDTMKMKDASLGSLPKRYTVFQLLQRQEIDGPVAIRLPVDTSGVTKKGETPVQSTIAMKFEYSDLVRRRGCGLPFTVPFVVNAKIYHVSGLQPDDAKGAIIRLRTSAGEECSKRCRGVHPKDVIGFGKRQAEVMVRLHEEGVKVDAIAAAYSLPPQIVEEVVAVSQGEFRRFGWDETLTMLVDDSQDMKAQLEICIQNQWLAVGDGPIQLDRHMGSRKDPAEASRLQRQLTEEKGPGGGECWRIPDYAGGKAIVGVSISVWVKRAMDDLTDPSQLLKEHAPHDVGQPEFFPTVRRLMTFSTQDSCKSTAHDGKHGPEDGAEGEEWCNSVFNAIDLPSAAAWSEAFDN